MNKVLHWQLSSHLAHISEPIMAHYTLLNTIYILFHCTLDRTLAISLLTSPEILEGILNSVKIQEVFFLQFSLTLHNFTMCQLNYLLYPFLFFASFFFVFLIFDVGLLATTIFMRKSHKYLYEISLGPSNILLVCKGFI